MAKNWEDFINEYATEQYDNAVYDLKLIEKMIESPIERVMFVVIRDSFLLSPDFKEMKLEPQKKIGKYVVDFYLSYPSKSGLLEFIIECDGHDYHERTKEQAAHDKKRDRYFTQNGYIVLRYTGSEIYRDTHTLTEPIWSMMVDRDLAVSHG